ncbi:DMT family transporter [Solimonas variicoloris]|uniref:DMT family transporter n=1 Tax=Solimonas variicoloris TaxID=254408 RepID=UPI000365FA5C|nr:DMT family transporter [Solimonas variicoloris]
MSPSLKAQLQIHFCVLLWGFTPILGKAISMPALALVWWRMLMVAAILLLVPRVWRGLLALPRRLLATYAGIGVIVALHWFTFYAAIKLANASVAATCLALAPVFLALIEPVVAQRRPDLRELVVGLAAVPGVALVAGGVPQGMLAGFAVGVLSALLVAVFGSFNKRYVDRADPVVVTAIELGVGGASLTLLAPLFGGLSSLLHVPGARDALLLAILVVCCTLTPFTIYLFALRRLTAFAAQLAVNLEPLYAIILAALLFGEQRELGASFYAGAAILLASVLVHPWLAQRARRRD